MKNLILGLEMYFSEWYRLSRCEALDSIPSTRKRYLIIIFSVKSKFIVFLIIFIKLELIPVTGSHIIILKTKLLKTHICKHLQMLSFCVSLLFLQSKHKFLNRIWMPKSWIIIWQLFFPSLGAQTLQSLMLLCQRWLYYKLLFSSIKAHIMFLAAENT